MIGGWNNWIEHPDYPIEDWRREVWNDETRLGYGAWVVKQSRFDAENPLPGIDELDNL
ncbi:hypothetical protein SEA_SPEEDDEMON_1470 [Gordonia phage SpeedDemon]|nr:hypothetical protein SEA_SPEEDDEMON_1470 [Gordonia phage SpeedDemon]